MGSFKADGGEKGPNRRRGKKQVKRQGSSPRLEWLEGRLLLAIDAFAGGNPIWRPTATEIGDISNGPMAPLGGQLIKVYQAFQSGTHGDQALAAKFPHLEFRDGAVLMSLTTWGDFASFQRTVMNQGMRVTASSAHYGMVVGWMPINQLPATAQIPSLVSGRAEIRSITHAQGTANNQAQQSMFADVASTRYNVSGAGVTVGVLSDSFNRLGGYDADVASGDLPANVRIVAEGTSADPSDEGRAMAQNIYDIAPGAGLQFATAFGGTLVFANNIVALANAGSDIIVDDVANAFEPFFQDGMVSQAVNSVVARNIPYFTSAGNSSDNGYLSRFRGVNATIAAINDGAASRYMNFNGGSGAVATGLPITTVADNSSFIFQFDQPFATQQPAGSTNAVTSNVQVYVLDASGAVVAQGADDTTATQMPWQFVTIPSAGTYTVVVRVVSGADPGNIWMREWGDFPVEFSQQFGTAGGTAYVTSFGHETTPNSMGVGATPWWAPSPFLNQQPLASEPFSSFGPGRIVRDSVGNLLATPITPRNPVFTAPDGGNTTFFGDVIQTNNPPFPGQPATQTNLSQDLPSFFGTSSAAPNAAAVAALMMERVPDLTVSQVRAGLIASARGMNGAGTGNWNAQAGYGLINAVEAISAVDVLTVASTTPVNQTLTSVPSYVEVTFSKAINFSTVVPQNLTFPGLPAGVTVTVGRPIAVDNPTTPTVVRFPISIAYNPNSATTANGLYQYVVSGPIRSVDGKTLRQSPLISFRLNDVSGPRVASTSTLGRQVMVKFNEPMNPATITRENVIIVRRNGASSWSGDPRLVNLSLDPRTTIRYDAATNTAILDLSALPQTALPSDSYAIVVISGPNGVKDAVGNQLDGEFSGSFPSGNGTNGGSFLQDLGFLQVSAPVITLFALDSSSINDTGIGGDSNTRNTTPLFRGQVYSSFPGTVANLAYYIQFNSLHGGSFNLSVGAGGRGFAGTPDVTGVTDANGAFSFIPNTYLPEGFQRARAVVVGQSDQPPLPGAASQLDRAFRVDRTSPYVQSAYNTDALGHRVLIEPNGQSAISSLPFIELDVVDPSRQAAGYLATPSNVIYPALSAGSAENLGNYELFVEIDGRMINISQYITQATYIPDAPSVSGGSIVSYKGRVRLTLAPGLPAGRYTFIAYGSRTIDGQRRSGLVDAAGNELVPSYVINFNLQQQPVYITNMAMTDSPDPNAYNSIGGPGAYFDVAGTRALAPPRGWMFDFSNPLPYARNGVPIDYADFFSLVRSADAPGSVPDGNFGTLGQDDLRDTGSGFTIVAGTTATLYYQDPASGVWRPAGPGTPQGTRLVLTSPTLASTPDYYRVYIANADDSGTGGDDRTIRDVFGNQLDGEFLGNPTSTVSSQFRGFSTNPARIFPGDRNIYNYETLLTTGYATPAPVSRMTGDGVAGGAYMMGFVVAATSHILYARPDYVEDPFDPSTAPDGSLAKPYSTLAPEGDPARAPANPTRDPNGGLNDSRFFLSGFNPNYDRNGNGRFDRSVLYAASQLAHTGPVVTIAIPGTPQRNPVTGVVTQQPFVLQAPAGPQTYNDASASVPFNTTLVFTPGTTLKAFNASLFVQNQGSALQIQGSSIPGNGVLITSYNDASAEAGGPTNGNPNTTPRPGDWGGVVFRNYNQRTGTRQATANFPVDGVLKGIGENPSDPVRAAIGGADELMSRINYATLRYGGGAVPRSSGRTYSGVTLYNTRPSITNTSITDTGAAGATQGAIGADMDSFLEDEVARGPLIRRVTVRNNSINGLWLIAQDNGRIQPTDATRLAVNGQVAGAEYTFFQPLPLVVLAQLIVGQQLAVNTGGQTRWVADRLNVDSGTMLRFGQNSALSVLNYQASLNVGSRDYMRKFDADNNYSPESDNFEPLSADDPKVLFTSLYDNSATTTLVPSPINVVGGTPPVQLGPGVWGSVGILTGSRAVINAAEFRYGGGSVNTSNVTLPMQSVLSLITFETTYNVNRGPGAQGSRVYVTNNDFHDNFDAAIQVEPDGLLAGDPLRPLLSGHPFLRGNVMERNGIDGLAVLANRTFVTNAASDYALVGPVEANLSRFGSNQSVDALWDLTDITYVLRGTIVPQGRTLTIQSALPGTLLADGTRIANPGASVVVKLLTENTNVRSGNVDNGPVDGAAVWGGAGFLIGVDDGVTSDVNPLIDPGVNSQIRILGVPGDQSIGQQRVPVIITSLRDTTVGTTARGVVNNRILNSYPVGPYTRYAGQSLTEPQPGDGGFITVGANSRTTDDLTDPRGGSLIDNADIRYISGVAVEGGGLEALTDRVVRMGLRISGSKLDSFSTVGAMSYVASTAIVGGERVPFAGKATLLYMYNNTISNMPVGVRGNAQSSNNVDGPIPSLVVLLNNTFYNNPTGVYVWAPGFNGQNSDSYAYSLLMNNIFSTSSSIAIQVVGQQYGAQLQYNLFDDNARNVQASPGEGFAGNISPRFGDPMFVDPATLNFAIQPGSAAIDGGRSEIGPNLAGQLVYPSVGILTLPGSGSFGIDDLWAPTLEEPAIPDPNHIPGTFYYSRLPAQRLGRRDLRGFIRIDSPGTPNTGTGANPFTDIGAFEYVDLNPASVTAVTAIYVGAAGLVTFRDFYSVGGTAGSNRTPDYVQFSFDSPIDPNSVNANTVRLQALGRTGNNVPGSFISLAGLLSYDVNGRFIRVSLANSGINLASDAYRFVLVGSGSEVLSNPQGVALDGENLTNGNDPATGVQRPLPSGNGDPGGNFYSTFIINTVPSQVVPGTFGLSAESDSNIVGDRVTSDTTPTFVGSISNTNTGLVPLGGQTAIVDIGIVSLNGNGDRTTYWSADSAPANLRSFIRPNAGTGRTLDDGSFAVTVGQDAAGTGWVAVGSTLRSSPYNVGGSGQLVPIPGSVGGYYVARVRIVDQSGNISNNLLSSAQTPFVVDDALPQNGGVPVVVTIDSPGAGSVITNPPADYRFQISANKNLDLTRLTATQIQLVRAGADGTFESGTTIAIDPSSIDVQLLDSAALGGGGGKGRERITFRAATALTNGLYQLTILGTGQDGIRDIAGNMPGEDLVQVFAVYSPSTARGTFVGAGYTTDPTAPEGSRANPWATINEAIQAAAFGDTVYVLPGIYTESVIMRNQVSLVSAGVASTDASIVRGDALRTVIRPNATDGVVSVYASGLTSFIDPTTGAALETRIQGLTIASSLIGDPALGFANLNSVGLYLDGSAVRVEGNYFINSGVGVYVGTSASAPGAPTLVNNAIVGNTTGLIVQDLGGTPTSATSTVNVINNTFAYNTYGLRAINDATTGSNQAYVANNIFWQNHDQTPSRNGLGVMSSTPNHLILNNNLFSGNGQSDTLPWWAAYNVGNGFDVAKLGPNAADAAANLGNYTGWPAFVSPVDPRPGADGPAQFYLSANFGLLQNSAAINNALASVATQTDLLGNFQNPNPVSRGLKLPGYGPRDVGAFEHVASGSATPAPAPTNPPTNPRATTPVPVARPSTTVATPAPAPAVIVTPTPAPAPAPTP
uniref:right-handed parallel beta-helix repeat-containing protein n=1 Tax=Paludisphaera sp. TaxID=2017432 RepID=UPI00301CE5A3